MKSEGRLVSRQYKDLYDEPYQYASAAAGGGSSS